MSSEKIWDSNIDLYRFPSEKKTCPYLNLKKILDLYFFYKILLVFIKILLVLAKIKMSLILVLTGQDWVAMRRHDIEVS